MLICAAGPRPATMRLALSSTQDLRSARDRYRLRWPHITKVSRSAPAAPSIIAFACAQFRQPPRTPTSNPHSARGAHLAPIPAVSFIGGFRTPAPSRGVPRTGKKPIYGKATGKRILALLDKPPPQGYGRWTGPLLAKALGDVDVQYVWRFLREHNIDLAARKSWCESNDPEFVATAADV